jgi:alkylhydroperoxidase family enzyme
VPSFTPDAGLAALTGQTGTTNDPREETPMGAPSKSFTLRNNTAEEQRRAGLWAAAAVLAHPKNDPHEDLAELLREMGLINDPEALDRAPMSKLTHLRGEA